VFELAQDQGQLNKLESDIQNLKGALAESVDLVSLINSPVYSRDAQSKAILAIASRMKLSKIMSNVLGLMASKRRLFVVPSLLDRLSSIIADHKGELSAEVTSAKALTKAQSEKLSKVISARVGKNVKINVTVDLDIIGGLVVKVGSKMIDSSIRSKLNSLQNVMKEVG
jgi:F-type H+-transporting ATPase subunit delta